MPNPLLMLSGCLGILMGLLAEVVSRTYFESQGKPVYLVDSTHNFDSDPAPRSIAYPSKKAA